MRFDGSRKLGFDRKAAHAAKAPVLIGVLVAAAVVVVLCGSMVFRSITQPVSFELSTADAAQDDQGQGGDVAGAQESARICVHVAGKVVNPGLYELAWGSRAGAAVDAAGGFAEGAQSDAINLARVLEDGEQLYIPGIEETGDSSVATSGSAPSSGSGGSSKVNINKATADELDALPGVGPSTAQKIIADREANGPFSSIEDLKRVSGIGDKKYEQLADSITVG